MLGALTDGVPDHDHDHGFLLCHVTQAHLYGALTPVGAVSPCSRVALDCRDTLDAMFNHTLLGLGSLRHLASAPFDDFVFYC